MKNVIPQTKEDNLEGLAEFLKDNLDTLRNECNKEMSGKILTRIEDILNLIDFEYGDRATREGV